MFSIVMLISATLLFASPIAIVGGWLYRRLYRDTPQSDPTWWFFCATMVCLLVMFGDLATPRSWATGASLFVLPAAWVFGVLALGAGLFRAGDKMLMRVTCFVFVVGPWTFLTLVGAMALTWRATPSAAHTALSVTAVTT